MQNNEISQKKENRKVRHLKFELLRHYPTLQTEMFAKEMKVWGRFPVYAGSDLISVYQIEAYLSPDDPNQTPRFFETGGRIPRNLSRHVCNDDTLCLFTSEERHIHWPVGTSFINLLKGPVNEYFLSQFYFEKKGIWIFGDRGHGSNGPLEFYLEQFQIADREQGINFVNALCGIVRPDDKCPCGSLRIGNCHYKKAKELQKIIPKNVFRSTLALIAKENSVVENILNIVRENERLKFKLRPAQHYSPR